MFGSRSPTRGVAGWTSILTDGRDGPIAVLEAVDSPGHGPAARHHFFFRHDWGRRLAAQFTIDPSHLSLDALAELIEATLGYLDSAADHGRTVDGPEAEVRDVQH